MPDAVTEEAFWQETTHTGDSVTDSLANDQADASHDVRRSILA